MADIMITNVLDVRQMAPKDRHPRIMSTFESLKPGESFVLVNDHEPRPLLYQFQNEYDGEFDWWPLEQGPESWRVQIAKRTEADPDRTVTEYLQTDHRRLDSVFDRFQKAVRETRWDDAVRDFKEFSLGLRRHIRIEEDILFPVFEDKTGMRDSGPTFVMRMEHKEIQNELDNILKGAEGKNEGAVARASSSLINILTDHNMKEEHILYPESDAFMTGAERAQVVKKAQAL